MTDLAFASPYRASRFNLVRLRTGLFDTPFNSAMTALALAAALWLGWPLLRWVLIDATWSGTAEMCRANGGACWVFVGEKLRLMVFGLYPGDRLWRPAVVLIALFGLVVVTMLPRFWRPGLLLAWIVVPLAAAALMRGTFAGTPVSTDSWGGLPLTMLLSIAAFAAAFPLAVLLALGRRSHMGGIRLLCISYVEVLRGVPMVVVLYVSTLVVPLMLPEGTILDKLLRAEIGLTLFISAYLAEIVRAGLQALPHGQSEAARALGLGFWQTTALVTMPQALKAVIPALVNLAIGLLQNTPLVAAIGIFDFLKTAQISADSDQAWLGFYNEAFVFAALVYFTLCFGASRYSLWLERRLGSSDRR